jgi:hypothetical protein
VLYEMWVDVLMARKVSGYELCLEHRTRSCMTQRIWDDVQQYGVKSMWVHSMGMFFLWWDLVLLLSFFCILFGLTFSIGFEEPSIELALCRAYPRASLSPLCTVFICKAYA